MARKKTWTAKERGTVCDTEPLDYYVLCPSRDDDFRIIEGYDDWGFTKEDVERFVESWHALETFDIGEIKSGKIPKILKDAEAKEHA